MAILKCKMCGGELNITEGLTVTECEYCGSVQTVPSADNEKKLTLFARANRLRAGCEFDKAAGVYETIVVDFPDEAEAYWGLVLCKYGIEYVDDPATGRKIPTCHRSSFNSVLEDGDFEQALENADGMARKVYREEARQIEELRRGIIAVSANEQPYDIFICYKETAENGERTLDSVLAQDIYDALTDRGYRVFFSRITLEDKLGMEYEPYIFAALNSAKVMLAVGTDYEYYNAVWVKNEWSRYLKLMEQDKSRHLIPCYRGIDPYDMPTEFKNLQGQDVEKLGFIQDLTRGITKIICGSAEKPAVTTSTPTGALTKRGYFFLKDGDFKTADEYFDRALDENPEDSKAYIGKVLADLHMQDVSEIDDSFVKLYGDKSFERAIRFSSGEDRAQLERIKENADRKWLVKCLTVGLKKIERKKETSGIFDEIKRLTATATVDAYNEIVRICTDATNRHLSEEFTLSTVLSYTRQLEIIRLLSYDYGEYTVEDVKRSAYFCGSRLSANDLKNDIARMVADGSLEHGTTPNTYCVAGSTEKRILKKKEHDYERALDLMAVAEKERNYKDCLRAAEIFASLENFCAANEKLTECKRLGEKLHAEIEVERTRQEERHRQELARQEAEWKAAEENRLAEIKAYNDRINAQIAEEEKKLIEQKAIYVKNAGKIFGRGAKLKKSSMLEIARLEMEIEKLKEKFK